MKITLMFAIILIFVLSFWGCDNNSTNSNGDPVDSIDSVNQIVTVWAEYETKHWDQIADTLIDSPAAFVCGFVCANPLPHFEYYKAGENTYSSENSYEYSTGYISFGRFGDCENYEPETINLDPLYIEIKTSFGKINGSIIHPDTVKTLTVSEYDTLHIGESFTISWSGSNADFYSVICFYNWKDEQGKWRSEVLSRFVTGNSVTYPGSIFSHNGDIDYIRVYPTNGPFPQADAIGNMIGIGSGFLYYETESAKYNEEIIVGSGAYNRISKNSFKKPSEKENRTLIRQKINSIVNN